MNRNRPTFTTPLIAYLDGGRVEGRKSRGKKSKLNYFIWMFFKGGVRRIWRDSNYF